jgi:hypothetical protein
MPVAVGGRDLNADERVRYYYSSRQLITESCITDRCVTVDKIAINTAAHIL